jgi:hypothetical protein
MTGSDGLAPASLDQVTFRRRGAGLIGYNPALAGEGYTLIAPQTADGAVYLIGMDGSIAHQWKLPRQVGRHAVLLENGNLGFNGKLTGTPDFYPAWMMWHGGAFSEVTPDGRVVWEYFDPMHHHDAQWLPNGNLLYGAMDIMPPEFVARIVGGSRAHALAGGVVYADVIKEVNRAGEIVWIWKCWEHMAPEEFPVHPIFETYHWPLINGLAVTKAGLVLMSLRTTSGVIAVDRASGAIVSKIGPDILAQQHTPVELDNGNILIFDNGTMRPGLSSHYSRVVEVDPVNHQIMWQYTDPMRGAFFSAYMGAAQRLPNGNTHITESATGRLFDVTPQGEIVWEYVIPFFAEYAEPEARRYAGGSQNSVFRSYRYQPSQVPWL